LKFLDVYLTFPDKDVVKIGEIAFTQRDNNKEPASAFRYTDEFLSHPRAFAIDPRNLPLKNQEHICERAPEDIHSVFEDSLPDAWGRRLLAKKYAIRIRQTNLAELLIYVGANGMGALSYGGFSSTANQARITELKQLMKAAELFEKGEDIEQEYGLLFGAGSSPGGARPKALVSDDETCYLAKFQSINDRYAMVPLEAATLDLARQVGLSTPDWQVKKLGSQSVLLVKRFDVTEEGGRLHMISLKTLVGDQFYLKYQDLLNVIRRYSSQPQIDVPAFYRHLCFNALIGNTDDHVKNYSMLHGNNGWFLSPAYDLLPNVGENPEHALTFQSSAYPPSQNALIKIGVDMFSMSKQKSAEMVQQIVEVLSGWENMFNNYDVPKQDIAKLKKDINRRLLL